jgi:hypothetical protein
VDLLGEIVCDHIAGDPQEKFTLDNCPKCLGKGVIGDIQIDEHGHLKTVSGINYLKQSIKKIITESLRASGYGFNYKILINSKDPISSAVKRELTRNINYLISLQNENVLNGYNYLPTEKLNEIEKIEVIKSTDPRQLNIILYCRTVSGSQFTLNTFINEA